jgi:hypothetical protein
MTARSPKSPAPVGHCTETLIRRLVALLADLDGVLALDDVEPLVLLVVHVPRRAALAERGDLGDAETSVRVQGRNLDGDHRPCEPDPAPPPKLIRGDAASRVYLRAFFCNERSFLVSRDPGSP